MVSKNSEAPLAATFGASIENNREGNIDMSSVQNKELSFHNVYGSTTYCNFYSHVKYSPLASSVRVI
ncbi:hypothetical protein ACVNFN_25705, partial [Klebsiella pneumoniae]